MRLIDRHIEYLLRRNDCVVVPGLGAFLCRYESARFDESGSSILPPGRCLAFNPWLVESDGMLINSVMRRERMSFDEAERMVRHEVFDMLSVLRECGEVYVGCLGKVVASAPDEELCFVAADVAGINGAFSGLEPISPAEVQHVDLMLPAVAAYCGEVIPLESPVSEAVPGRGRRFIENLRAYASGVVATLAVLVTLALFVMSPIRINTNTQTASIAPVADVYRVDDAQPTECDVVEITEVDGVSDVRGADADINGGTAGAVEPQEVSIRFNDADRFIVVVASFPTREQADVYVSAHRGERLGVVEMSGKFRVYAATGAGYGEASEMRKHIKSDDAWVCRR